MNEILGKLATSVVEGDKLATRELTETALEGGLPPEEVLNNGLMPGMEYVGREFKAGNMFVPEVLRSARAMQGSMDVLRPLLAEAETRMAGKLVIGTVKGDLHDIGKNLVAMMCEGAGLEVIDLGKDVDPSVFVDAVRDLSPDIVGMSALLTTTMRAMGNTIHALEEAGVRDQVKVIVGGAPVTEEFAKQIGADAYVHNAAEAADLARQLVK